MPKQIVPRLITTLLLVALFPAAALAAEEPYSDGTTPETTVASEIDVVVSGLTATFSISGVSNCTWDFGDGATGEGNPVSHTYAEDGRYDVTATCDGEAFSTTVAVGALATTGTQVSSYLFWGGGLLLAGLTVLAVTGKEET